MEINEINEIKERAREQEEGALFMFHEKHNDILVYNTERGEVRIEMECNSGWYGLLDELLFEIKRYCTIEKIQYPQIAQIKEKFGTLRFYTDSVYGTEQQVKQIMSFIDDAEEKSVISCENCGALGAKPSSTGWIKTLCPKCTVTTRA